ncbi:MAG: hypothetical protein M3R44_03820, partial [Candidatus Eremiobacteraeota bacterium]|nr:hypothetical protein [Candidatus Eremiobacteraeota bacterium]
ACTDQADLVVRLDAHTIYEADYVATIDEAFATLPSDVWSVGGATTPHPQQAGYGSALGIALYSNPLGLGPNDYRRSAAAAREVTSVYLGAYRPGVLQRLGGFDERWAANEDSELNERIRAAGGRVFRIPVRLGRLATRGPAGMVRQWSRYGYWRMQTLRHYPEAMRMRHVAPPIALALGLALALSRARALLVPLYGAYALAAVLARRRGERASVTLGTLVFFPVVHTGYACGLLAGLLRPPPQLRRTERGRTLVVRRARGCECEAAPGSLSDRGARSVE